MDLELSQRQGLTLAMQTSMRLLQLNNLQLRSYLGELMTSNAVVELEFPEIEYRPGPFEQHGGIRRTVQTDGDAIPTEQLIPDHASDESILRDLFLQAAALKQQQDTGHRTPQIWTEPPCLRLDQFLPFGQEHGFRTFLMQFISCPGCCSLSAQARAALLLYMSHPQTAPYKVY